MRKHDKITKFIVYCGFLLLFVADSGNIDLLFVFIMLRYLRNPKKWHILIITIKPQYIPIWIWELRNKKTRRQTHPLIHIIILISLITFIIGLILPTTNLPGSSLLLFSVVRPTLGIYGYIQLRVLYNQYIKKNLIIDEVDCPKVKQKNNNEINNEISIQIDEKNYSQAVILLNTFILEHKKTIFCN